MVSSLIEHVRLLYNTTVHLTFMINVRQHSFGNLLYGNYWDSFTNRINYAEPLCTMKSCDAMG